MPIHFRILFMLALAAFAGCRTEHFLRDNTNYTTSTLADLNYQQVLDNLARFVANASTMPSIAVINAGTVTVGDTKTVNGSVTYAPTLTFAQQNGGQPLLSLLFNPSASRNLTENWSLQPVTDIDNLRRIRCAFQILVQNQTGDECDQCLEDLQKFYLGEQDRMDCILPRGWYQTGCKKDVPKNACYVGHCHDTYVWVLPDGVEGLTRFTMTVIDLATGKPHAPMKTVVRTYKADGKLDTTQVTTTEIDRDALEKEKKESGQLQRTRIYINPPVVNPGLFFVR